MTTRLDLTRSPRALALLRSRWPQFLLRAITLAGFIFTILAGLMGSVVGSHNFAIIFVWIAWWTALKLVFIPFGGRSWCSICPIPMPGEWLQNGGILQPRGRAGIGLGKRWPKFLRGTWMQAGGFLLIGLFGALTLTSAKITAIVLLFILVLALVLSLVFERRSFCNYLCPIGGFTGLYAQAGPVELQVKAAQNGLAQVKAVVSQAEAGLAQAQAILNGINLQIAKATVTSPIDGVLLTRNLETGETVSPGSTLMTIGQLEEVELVVYIPEDSYGEIYLGEKVEVRVDSFPGETFNGTVAHISDQAEFTPRNVQTVEGRRATVYAVKLLVPNPDLKLKPGMPADVTFAK